MDPKTRKEKREDYRSGTEAVVPENSPLIGMTLEELEDKLGILFHHYHRIDARGRTSSRITENLPSHRVEAKNILKYFGKEIGYVLKLAARIESGEYLEELKR